MKIGIAVQNDYPADTEVRPRKVARTLSERGHEAVVFARADGHRDDRTIEHARVKRFSMSWAGPLSGLITTAFPLNAFWICWFAFAFKHEEIDAVVASNIRAGLPAILAARFVGVPSVLDLQENNPEVVKLRPRDSPIHYIARDPRVVMLVERACIWLADEVWVVVKERRANLLSRGVSPEKLRIVNNTPLLDEVNDDLRTTEEFDWPGFVLVYVGAISELRGLDRILEALPSVLEEVDDVTVAIAGDGPHLAHLQQRAEQLGVEENVNFVGWISPERVSVFLRAGDVGLIPHEVTRFTETTAPNKLFDYMAAGLPVLATDMTPVRRVLEETGAGRTLPVDPSPAEIAEAILAMRAEDLSGARENGQTAVEETYNWCQESEEILDSFQTVTGTASARSQP